MTQTKLVYVTLLLIGVFSATFIAELFLDPEYILMLAFVPSNVTAAMVIAEPGRLAMATLTVFTAMFLHGSWSHLAGNCLFLYLVGKPVERTLGSSMTALLYFGGGLFAALVYLVSEPSSTVPCIGASGGIACLMSVYFVLLLTGRVTLNSWWRTIIGAGILSWFAWNFFEQYLVETGQQVSDIAYWVNISGFLAGLFLATVVLIASNRVSAPQLPVVPES